MIRHVWTVFCAKTSIDQQSNSISLFESIEGLEIDGPTDAEFPITLPFRATLVTLWTRADPDHGGTAFQRVRLLDPSGHELGEFFGTIDVEDVTRTRTVMQMDALKIGGGGRHEWEVCSRPTEADEWSLDARVPVDVSYEPVAGPEGSS